MDLASNAYQRTTIFWSLRRSRRTKGIKLVATHMCKRLPVGPAKEGVNGEVKGAVSQKWMG